MKKILIAAQIVLLCSTTACQNTKTQVAMEENKDEIYMLLGNYAKADEQGILVYKFNQETAQDTLISGVSGISNPSFLCISKDASRVYAVGEDEGLTSTANALSFDKNTGTLTLLNSQLTQGGAPCNISLSPNEDFVYTANYHGGNLSEFRVKEDGTLDTVCVIPFKGTGAHPERQTKPYLHSAYFTPDNKLMLANDLGTDSIHIFPVLDAPKNGSILDKQAETSLYTAPGAGPRHMCFAPNGKRAYLIAELSGDIFTLRYEEGKLEVMQTIKADTVNAGGSADIHISADGQFVYASHRLSGDGISIHKVNQETGELTRVGYQPTGRHPRNFAITPNGKYVLVACMRSNEVQIYERNAETGLLKDTGKRIIHNAPVCIKFI